jgi:2-polyprenyl-3-methyl-5-hydroxy-6-metoxy-1,4-benzoquinol methylase
VNFIFKMNTQKFSEKRFADIKEYRDDKFNLKKVHALISRYVPEKKGKSLLDIGCSDGSFAAILKKRFHFDVYGVDIAKRAIDRAKLNGIKAQVADLAKRFPYKNNTFDVIIMCEVIEHIFDTDFLLQEIHRVLKNGGFLFITTPNVASFTSRIKLIFGGYPNGLEYCINECTNGHIRAYTPLILRKQLNKNKFKVVKLTSPNILFPVKSKLIPNFIKDSMIHFSDLTKNLGEQIVIAARK